MKSRLFFLAVLVFYSFSAHTHNLSAGSGNQFIIKFNNIDLLADIQDVFLCNGGIIGRYESDSFFVFNKQLETIPSLERQLNHFKYIFSYADTIYVGDDHQKKFILNNQLYPLKAWPTIHHSLPKAAITEELFNDEHYYIYTCCMGEFGGSIYMFNKRTENLYTYPVWQCCTQLIKWNSHYYAFMSLNHLGYSQYLLKFQRPETLFKSQYKSDTSIQTMLKKYGSDYFCCGCQTSDSLHFQLFMTSTWDTIMNNMHASEINQEKLNPFRLAFTYKNSLFTIRESDSLFHINLQNDTSKIEIQTIKKTRATKYPDYYDWQQNKFGDTYLAYSHNTIITVTANKIDILQDTSFIQR